MFSNPIGSIDYVIDESRKGLHTPSYAAHDFSLLAIVPVSGHA